MSVVSDLFSYIFLFFVVSLPIIIWAYVFSYIAGEQREFLLLKKGIIAGTFSLLPFVFLQQIYTFPFFSFFDVFKNSSLLWVSLMSYFSFFSSLIFLLSFLFIFSLISRFILIRKPLYINKRSICFFLPLFFSVFFISSFLFFLFRLYPHFLPSESFFFSGIYFTWFFSLFWYYFLTAFWEEVSKFFHFSQIYFSQSSILLSLFVALGFVFLENFLYVLSIFQDGKGAITQVIVFRSLFSLMLHSLCTLSFTVSFLSYTSKKSQKIFLYGSFALFSILLHSIFNIALSYGIMWIGLLFFVWGYFYISKTLLEYQNFRN